MCKASLDKNQIFIEKAKNVHGNKYDYSLTEYFHNKIKIKIICLKHGVFEQTPNSHLNNQGCIKCGYETVSKKNRHSKDDFIKKATEIHGDNYNYDLVDYKNGYKDKISIKHNKCGEIFVVMPNAFLSGIGCSKCGKYKKCDTQKFIEKSKKIHGDNYNYDLVDYKNAKIKIHIKCVKCNHIFKQSPDSHLLGSGCDLCAKEKRGNKLRHSKDDFIKKATEIHGDNYNYDLVDYKNSWTKIEIKCNTCNNVFKQLPNSHTHKNIIGCPYCKESKGEKKIRQFLLKNNIKFQPQKKFETCKNFYKLPFDFCVYVKEKIYLIEFQGRQHYEIIKYSHNDNLNLENFKKLKINDKIKKKWCIKNKIPLLAICYKDYSKIEELIYQHLN